MVQPASKRLVTEAALPEAVRNVVEASFVSGPGIAITHNGAANTITIEATGTSGLDLEAVQDAVAAMILEGFGLTATYDDTAGTYTVTPDVSAQAETIRDTIASTLVAGTGAVITSNDAGDTVTIDIEPLPIVDGTTVALIGASITYLSATNAGVYEAEATATGYISAGIYPWANAFLGGRLTLLDNFGVGGQTSEQILDQVDSVLALPEKPTFVIVGEPATNGVYQGIETSAQVIANLDSIIDALSAEGINTVLQTNPPSDALNTAPELTAIGEVNAWIRKQNNRSGVIVADIEPYLIDPVTGAPKTGVTYDGTHFANLGGLLSGKALADALRPYVGGSVDLAASNVDGRSLTLNPMMVGTAGAKAGGITGQVADSWTATWSTVGTAVCSKVPATDHVGGEWQRIQMTSQGAFYLQQTINTGLVVGDVYLLEGEFRTQDWVNITTMSLELFTNLVEYRRDLATSLSPVAMPSPGWGVFRTPKYTVLPGTTYLSANVVIGGSSGIVDLRRLRIRKVVS